MSLVKLQKNISYEFKDNSLLDLAITHKSSNNLENNERLEFIGDSVLNAVISEHLYKKFPNEKEGLLTRMRSHLVKGETLVNLANKIYLSEYIKLSKGTANLSELRKHSILEGAFESLIGAVLLDSDWNQAKKFVLNLMKSEIQEIGVEVEFRDSKTELQEYLQAKKINPPKYESRSINDGFEASITYQKKKFVAAGSSKRHAERAVAKKILDFIKS